MHASFDDPHLVSRAGLVPVVTLAQRCGLTAEHVKITSRIGVNAHLKIPCLVAGMAAGRTASMTWTCAPLAAPVIATIRRRGGTANSARGAASLAAGAITTARQAEGCGLLVFRIDSTYYSAAVLHAIRRGGARFSVTVPVDRKIRAAIASISEDAWTRSPIPAPSGMRTRAGRSPTRRSPRCRSRRSRPGSDGRSPPG